MQSILIRKIWGHMSNFDDVRLQLQLPRITSLLFAGAGSYIAFIDP